MIPVLNFKSQFNRSGLDFIRYADADDRSGLIQDTFRAGQDVLPDVFGKVGKRRKKPVCRIDAVFKSGQVVQSACCGDFVPTYFLD